MRADILRARGFQVAATPRGCFGIFDGGNRDHPVNRLDVAEEVQFLCELGDARPRILLAGERIDGALPFTRTEGICTIAVSNVDG